MADGGSPVRADGRWQMAVGRTGRWQMDWPPTSRAYGAGHLGCRGCSAKTCGGGDMHRLTAREASGHRARLRTSRRAAGGGQRSASPPPARLCQGFGASAVPSRRRKPRIRDAATRIQVTADGESPVMADGRWRFAYQGRWQMADGGWPDRADGRWIGRQRRGRAAQGTWVVVVGARRRAFTMQARQPGALPMRCGAGAPR